MSIEQNIPGVGQRLAITSSQYQGNIISSGPDRYWPLNDAAGSLTVHELVANSAGNVNGGVTLGVKDPWGNAGAAMFDGVSGEIIDSNALNISSINSQYSMEFFYNTVNPVGGMLEFNAGSASGNGISNQHTLTAYMGGGTTLTGSQLSSGAVASTVTDVSATNDGTWHHCVITFDGHSLMSMYRDGALQSTMPITTVSYSAAYYWRIGHTIIMSTSNTAGGYFGGSIAHVAIYSRCITAAEIAIHYGSWVNLAVQPPVMPPNIVWLELLDTSLNSQGLINYATINAQLYYNAVGSWSILCPYSDVLWNQMMSGEFIASINWRGLFTFGGKCEQPSYMDSIPGSTGMSAGGGLFGPFIAISGSDYLALIANRIAYPDPTSTWNNQLQNDAYVMVNIPLETAIKSIVNANMGWQTIQVSTSPPTTVPPAISSRQMSMMDIAPDAARGPAINYAVKFGSNVDINLLDVLRALISLSNPNMLQNPTLNMGLRLVRNGKRLLFDVFIPRDLSSTIWFSEDTGNLTSINFSLTDPTCTDALVQGASAFVQANSPNVSQWNKVEQFIDSSSETSTPNLNIAAQDALFSGAQGPNLSTTVTDTPFAVFGRDFYLGDIVSVQVRNGDVYTDVVSGVTLTADPSQQPIINVIPTIGNTSNPTSSDKTVYNQLINRIKTIEKRLASRR